MRFIKLIIGKTRPRASSMLENRIHVKKIKQQMKWYLLTSRMPI